jgi:DNA-binding phage protein
MLVCEVMWRDNANVTDRLATAVRSYRRADAALKRAREELHVAVREAVAAGQTKSAVARSVGYTREYVAKLCDEP